MRVLFLRQRDQDAIVTALIATADLYRDASKDEHNEDLEYKAECEALAERMEQARRRLGG